MSDLDLLQFPSGRSVGNCRNDAKRLAKEKKILLGQAQEIVANHNGIAMPWDKAMAALKANPPRKPNSEKTTPTMTQANIQAVMERFPALTHFGMGIPMHGIKSAAEIEERYASERKRLLAAEAECNKALRFLEYTTKRKTLNTRRSSYGLKHRVEYYMKHLPEVENYYVANGAFICAAIHAGFDIRQIRHGSPNVNINISEKSPIFLWERMNAQSLYYAKDKEQLAELCNLIGVPVGQRAKVNW